MNTSGDLYEVECPVCGEIIRDLWDLGASLTEGAKFDCSHCKYEITVEKVDTVVTVTLSAPVSTHKKGEE